MTDQEVEIVIRAMEPDDWPDYLRILNAPEVISQTSLPPFAAVSERGDRPTNTQSERNLVAEIDSAIVGFGTLILYRDRRAHAASLALAVDPDHHGAGVGSTILQALLDLGERWYGIRRFELTVYTDNQRAVALYERFGFEIEATHRQFALRDGEYADAYAMARLVS